MVRASVTYAENLRMRVVGVALPEVPGKAPLGGWATFFLAKLFDYYTLLPLNSRRACVKAYSRDSLQGV